MSRGGVVLAARGGGGKGGERGSMLLGFVCRRCLPWSEGEGKAV